MARKSFVELRSQTNGTINDNTVGDISPLEVRTLILDILNAIQPAYGVLSLVGPAAQTAGITPAVVMNFSSVTDSDATQTTSVASPGRITRSERGTSVATFTTDFEAANGRFVTFSLYKNGVLTPWRVTGNGGGAGNPVAVSLTAIDYADPAAFYDIRITAELAATVVTLSNAAFVLRIDPVNTF